jgi:hypothetical protein
MPDLKLRSSAGLTQADKQRKLFNYMVLGAYALMAQIATNLYFKVEVEFAPARLVDLADFVARRPYQYRVLIPAIVHVFARLLHASQYQYFPLYQGIEIGCVFATLIAFRRYLSQFISPANSALLAGSILVPMTMIHVSCAMCRFPSDTPAILFFILGLIAMQKRAFPLLYLALAIGTINRESSAMLVIAFAAGLVGEIPWRRYAAHLCGLSLVWILVKLAVDHIFAGNTGGAVENHMLYNRTLLWELLRGQAYVLATATFLLAIPASLFLGRKLIPPFLLRLLVLVPIYAAIMWQVGIFDEVRAWNEIVPVVLTPIVVLLSQLADRISNAKALCGSESDKAPVGEVSRAA